MTLSLVSKETILEKIVKNDTKWFEKAEYFEGSCVPTPKYNSDETSEEHRVYEDYWNRRLAGDLTPEEKHEESVLGQVKTVEERNEGDGNLASFTLYFEPYDLYVTLTGTYSSWDSTEYTNIEITRPYQYTETRYAKV